MVGLTRVSGNWTFRSPTWTAGGVSRSTTAAVGAVVVGAAVATLGRLEADGSNGVEAVGGLGKTTERRFEEMIDAEPGRISSLAGTGPGVAALDRPKDLRWSECRERWSGDGGLVGTVGIGGRKA